MQEKQQIMKENTMKNSSNNRIEEDDMREEYDFSDSMPNKYAAKLNSQELLRQLEPDVRKIFDTPEKVNNALRAIIQAYPKKKKNNMEEDDLLEHYDFDYSKAKPNRFAQMFAMEESIKLDADVRKVFDTPEKVNNALRAIIQAYPKKKKKVKELG